MPFLVPNLGHNLAVGLDEGLGVGLVVGVGVGVGLVVGVGRVVIVTTVGVGTASVSNKIRMIPKKLMLLFFIYDLKK